MLLNAAADVLAGCAVAGPRAAGACATCGGSSPWSEIASRSDTSSTVLSSNPVTAVSLAATVVVIVNANANGSSAMTYNDAGIYSTVGTSFQTPRGQTIQRPTNQYERFSAIINTASNYVTVADNAAQRRATIKTNIAQTTQQLQNATTDAEVQKLHGVLTSLNGDLASTDDEVNQAAASATVQDIQNRNDQQKQIQALTEQQNAEFTEAVSNYTAKFLLLDTPTAFPTP